MRKALPVTVFIASVFAVGFVLFYFIQRSPLQEEKEIPIINMNGLVIKSSAFKNNEFIPAKYTCEGENVNPLLEILNVPPETKSLVLIMDDPDAPSGTWDHWIMWNIDPKTHYIPEDSVPAGAVEGTTSFGRLGYGGPCPPRGDKPHRYMFKVYALDTVLDLKEGAVKAELEKAMAGHILDQTTLIGLYQRK